MNRTILALLCLAPLLLGVAGLAQNPATGPNVEASNAVASNNNSPVVSVPAELAAPEQTAKLEERLEGYMTGYRNAQWRYSWAYHLFVYGAAVLSSLAALLSKIHVKIFGLENPTKRDNWVASLAAIAALFIAISTAGKLGDSWQDNKAKRYAVEGLLNQLVAEQNPTSDELEAYGKRLAGIIDPNSAPIESKTAK